MAKTTMTIPAATPSRADSGAPAGGMTAAPTPSILALIPAHNEEKQVTGVIARVRAQGLPVLVVDDGSTDSTAERALGAGAKVLTLSPNRGKGGALKAGFREALELGYDLVLTLDADGQHDPAEIPGFAAAWSNHSADLIVGARDFRRMPIQRRISNTVGRMLFSRSMGRPILDNQSGYRLHSRRLIEAVLDSEEEGFAFEVEVIAVCVGRGYSLEWVPIRTIYGDETSHIKPWQHVTSFVRVNRRAARLVARERRRRTLS